MISIFNDNIIGFPLTPMGILGSKCITPNRSVKKVCHRRGSVFQVPVRDSCHVGESQEPNTSSHYFNDTRPRLMRKVTQQQGLWFPFTTAVTPPTWPVKVKRLAQCGRHLKAVQGCKRARKMPKASGVTCLMSGAVFVSSAACRPTMHPAPSCMPVPPATDVPLRSAMSSHWERGH